MTKRKQSKEFLGQAVKQTLMGDKEPETRKKSSAEEELKRIRAENASLRMDNTILKK